MSLYKNIIQMWKAKDLLSQAWEDSYAMLKLSNEIFHQTLEHLKHGENAEKLIELKKRDYEINEFQRNVRRKVLTHYVIEQDTKDIVNGLVLLNIVVDIERIGDYCKNILDLAIHHKQTINAREISTEIYNIENEVKYRFEKTMEAIHSHDQNLATSLKEGYKERVAGKCDELVNQILRNEVSYNGESRAAAIALYVRYLKRVGGHLKNITSTLTNPYDAIGYNQ